MNLDQALEYARQVGLSDAHIAVTVRSAADAKRFEQLGDNVLMRHPDLDGQEIAVHPSTVEQYEAGGWRRVDLGAPADAAGLATATALYGAVPAQVSTAGAADQHDDEENE